MRLIILLNILVMIDYISMRLCCDSKLRPNEEFKLELLPFKRLSAFINFVKAKIHFIRWKFFLNILSTI